MIDIRPDDLLQKSADTFLRDGAQKVANEIAEVRFKHFQTKRIANIIRVYDYMSLAGMLRGKQKLSPMGATLNSLAHRQNTLRLQ